MPATFYPTRGVKQLKICPYLNLLGLAILFFLSQLAVAASPCQRAIGAHKPLRYTTELPKISSPGNQGCLGVCHIYTLKAQLDQEMFRRGHKDITFDLNYLLYRWLQTRALQYFHDHWEGKKPIKLSGMLFENIKLVRDYGLIPNGVWQNKRYPNDKEKVELIETLGKEIKTLKSLSEAETLITHRLNAAFGEPPSTFTFRGERFSPVIFYQTFLGELQMYQFSQQYVNPPVFRVLLAELLKNGFAVNYSSYISSDMISSYSGVVGLPPEMSSKAVAKIRQKNNTHATLLTAFTETPAWEFFKARNSWGVEMGDHGYLHIREDAIDAWSERLAVIATPESLKILKKVGRDPSTVLSSWSLY